MLEHRQLQCWFMDNLDTFTIYRSVDQRGPWREVVQRLFYRTDAAVVARISDNEVICLLRIPTCCSGGFGCELQSPSLQWCEKFRILVAIYKYHLWSIKCLTALCGIFDRYKEPEGVTLLRQSNHSFFKKGLIDIYHSVSTIKAHI